MRQGCPGKAEEDERRAGGRDPASSVHQCRRLVGSHKKRQAARGAARELARGAVSMQLRLGANRMSKLATLLLRLSDKTD